MFQSNEYAEIEENDFAEFDFEDEADEFSQVITEIYIIYSAYTYFGPGGGGYKTCMGNNDCLVIKRGRGKK